MQITAALVKELRERTGAGMMDCKKALVEAGGDIELAIDNMRKAGQAKAERKAGRIAAEGLIGIATAPGDGAAAMVEVNCETDFVAKGDDFRGFVALLAERALAERSGDADALLGAPMESGGAQTVDQRRLELVATIGENIAVRRVAVIACEDGIVGSYSHGGRIGVLVEQQGGNPAVARDIAMHVAASRPLAVAANDLPAEDLAHEREILEAQVAESGKPEEIRAKMIDGRITKYLREVTLLGQPFVKNPDETVAKYLDSHGAAVRSFLRFEVGEGLEKRSENFAEEVMSQVRQGGAGG